MKLNITIGIPTHKRPKLLKRAVNSLIYDENINVKIIISVDGIDNTFEEYKLIEKSVFNKKNISFIYHETKIGSLKNFLYLRDICDTEYFMWLADDDESSLELVCELQKLLDNNLNAVTAVPYWELKNEKNEYKIIQSSHFNDQLKIKRVFKYIYDSDDVFFYGLHRAEKLKKCSFNNYWWPNKDALSNWCYVFQMDLVLQGKIILLDNSNLRWTNHDYGIKYYPRSSSEKIIKNFSYIMRRINIYYLYILKFLKWKKYIYIIIFILPFIFLLARDIIFKEPVNKRIKF